MREYEIIIVGGGPAGSTAGKILAEKGKKCLIIDKDEFPRDKLCGGMITEKTIESIHEIYKGLRKEDFIDSEYNTYGINGSKFERICEFTHPEKKIYFVNRINFDDYLFNKAVQSGSEKITGKKVVEINKKKGKFIVILETGEKFFCNILIGADGANSIVRKSFIFCQNKNFNAVGLEAEIRYEDTNFFHNRKIFPEIFFGILENGYGWVFPKKDKIIIGIGGPIKNNNNLRKIFIGFLDKITITNKSYQSLKIKGFPVPFNNFLHTPAKDNVLLTGDAAGFVEAITGEGIYFALKSGQLAAEAINSGNPITKTYNNLVYENIIKFIKQSYFVKKFFFHQIFLSYELRLMKRNEKYARYYFELLSGEIDYWGYLKKIIF
ncbi:MAG: geranylgeranyl reductase family protein [bacterium]